MGIKNLNRYFMECCNDHSIEKRDLRDFSGKTIVVDTSIYLYKFVGENALMENMYLMISLFKEYNIRPIFVFDGKSPVEKRGVLLERQKQKKIYEMKYNAIKYDLEKMKCDDELYYKMKCEMERLKKQCIRIHPEHIEQTKELFRICHIEFYDADGEADKLCACIVKSGEAWACMTDDMDMFAYGCDRVLRHLSLLHHTAILYDTESILKNLKITKEDLREILILSGTDYNNRELDFVDAMNLFREYSECTTQNIHVQCPFYYWLSGREGSVDVEKYNSFLKVYDLFTPSIQSYISFTNSNFTHEFSRYKLKDLLTTHGFLFVY